MKKLSRVGEAIHAGLESEGMTIPMLAHRLNRSNSFCYQILHANRKVPVKVALELEKILGISARDLWLLQAEEEFDKKSK